ncbi:dna rna-binding protein alba [Cystoisospora suis]|uniref:Dna rna-binding protein alba n=1 Tax=Cystoisospora suis TaxID=483139 RepID=A0A2C6KJ16_9APIC|nr:dna rna-binding protein alba [Cystoisospora suis]
MPDTRGNASATPAGTEGNVEEAGTGTERYGVAPHPEFPTARTLLISYRRSRAFLERTARELLAGGTEYIMLSALGDAIPLAVQLQHALESKNAATTVRIETVLVQSPPKHHVGGGGGGVSPGLHIVVQKHPQFRGSRISPGTTDLCLSSGRKEIASLLEAEGFSITTAKEVHTSLLSKALEENHGKDDADVKAAMIREPPNFPNVKLAVCRPCMALGNVHSTRAVGAVFVTCFKDKFPHGEPKNAAMVYVVAPELAHFGGDVNAYMDAEELNRVTKPQIASAILRGLEKGYRHGPGPRLSFEYDEDVFRNAWIEMTGLDPTAPPAAAEPPRQEGDSAVADGRKNKHL